MRGQPGVGSMWTWTAIDADTKLMISWRLGARDASHAHAFIRDTQERLANRVQLTTDGNRLYLDAVLDNFAQIDFAMLQKLYGPGEAGPEARYSPAKCNGTKKKVVMGNPDHDHVSTSYAERQNLNIRMGPAMGSGTGNGDRQRGRDRQRDRQRGRGPAKGSEVVFPCRPNFNFLICFSALFSSRCAW